MTNEYLQPLWDAFEKFADKTAVVAEGGKRQTTYRELGQLSRRIAGGLLDKKFPANSFIPVILADPIEYLAAEMGVWMAGHSIVPMGINYPPERIEHITRHTEAPLVIDQAVFDELAKSEPLADVTAELPMESNALLIYTSGSTGEPKGILHGFDSLNFGVKYTDNSGFTPDSKWGSAAPFYFIAAAAINFRVLSNGGELHLYNDEVKFNIRKMEDYIEDFGITHTFISPAVLPNFHNRSKTLKSVSTGSEKLSGQASRDGYVLTNTYGMSEMIGGIEGFVVDRPYDSTPVGRIMPGAPVEWKLVDADGKEVAKGEEGELLMKGVFTKGYYKDPERTAKLYQDGWLHTGDIFRELPDGNLVYINRKDWMMKINGQRVEPGEVENAMKRIPGVRQAVVKGFEGKDGSAYLCGYYVAAQGSETDPDEIRKTLAEKLPPYMVPRYIKQVENFSLLPNGKVNRKALLPPDASDLQTNYVAPSNDKERMVCEAFEKVFKLDRAGIDDDFFMLGGDSIKVMALQHQCEGLNLTSKIIYKGRTPRGIAAIAETADENKYEPIPSVPVPLSQTQLGIYAESMARKGEASYNNPMLLRLDASIDAEKLAKALEKAVEAHPFIKTTIREDEEGNPVMVAVQEPYTQKVEDLTEKDIENLKDKLIQPFDLHKDRLFRIRVMRTPENLYLFTDFHHIIYDGTSMSIFSADVDRAYHGEEVEAETWTGYNVAQEEKELRQTDVYKDAKEWYINNFGAIDLDSRPVPDRQEEDVRFGAQDASLGVTLQEAENFCRRLGITPNILTLAAFGRLLGAFTNMQEALFSTIYNGRSSLKTARTMDMMVKTLPVYCRWDSDTLVSDYLLGMKKQIMGAMNNDIYSFAELAAATGINSDVLFAYQGDNFRVDSFCSKPSQYIELERNATGSPMDLQVFVRDGMLTLHTEYMLNMYSDEFIRNFNASYATVLQSFLRAEYLVETDIANAEQLSVLDSFNQTERPYDNTHTIVSLFDKAAAEYPDNLAVVYEDKKYTYRQVAEMAENLAALINERGVGKGDVVSILIHRGEWIVIASLGALKAGCAYQPLDSTYPKERLNFMIQDSGAKLLITDEDLREIVNEYEGDVLYLSQAGDKPQKREGSHHPEPSGLFTLLYTSGSTGVPKGVCLTHANLVCFVDWYKEYFKLDSECVVGAYASYGFDANMMDMYPALTCGAAVCIVPENIRLDMEALNEYLLKNKVTHQFLTTQVGRQFATDVENDCLRCLGMGGEKLIPFPLPSNYKVYNLYGPTEGTILVTSYQCVPDETNIPIGHIIDNVKGYIVGLDGKRLPVGAVGELWIAGPHVANGYLNRPDKTAEVFIDNPFEKGDYTPLYRTGDAVRYMPDGNIEFIGRQDGQVKIRGFRIELSEVEMVVREFPGIKDATVAAFDHPSGGKFIAAYVVSDEPVDTEALAAFIRERKPPYMVPAVTMQIDRIPLNQNGKVNRRALPAPEFQAEETDDSNRPLNVLEQELKEIVSSVLGVEEFGVTTPLVNLGLTSILSIKLATRILKRFGIELKSKSLLDGASIETIENLILKAWLEGGGKAVTQPAGQSAGGEVPQNGSPLSFPQTGVYFESMKKPTEVVYNIPTMLVFKKTLEAETLANAVRHLVGLHPGLNTHFDMIDGEVRQIANSEDVEIEVEILEMSDSELEKFENEFVRPFRLSSGPLCRFAIVTTETRVALLCDFHHLVFDGTSLNIFMNQLGELLKGNEVEAEPYSYSDYVADEKRFEQSAEFEENRNFFTEMLGDFEHASELTADLKGDEKEGLLKAAAAEVDIDAVSDYARDHGLTPAAVMLAATFYAVSRYVNDHHVYLSTISSGRSDLRTADTFGMFVNTLPLGITITDESVEEFIRRSADVFAGVLDHEKYPFAKVAADYGYQPEIVYEYQMGVVDNLDIPHIDTVKGLELNLAKFKISIHIELFEGKPSVVVFYNDALYTHGLAENLARSIAIVTEKMLAGPEKPVLKIDLIDEERGKILQGYRTEALAEPKYHYFQEGMEEQARLHPERKALIACDGEFTYKEFDQLANRIANSLIERGVEPRSRIALLLPRTSRVILSMFGVMKAGCAYIPCDPEYPTERIQHILNDSEAPYVITTADRLGDFTNAIDVETLFDAPDTRPETGITPQDLAYLIYTSGSTGKPKGVMLRHESIANYLTYHPANTHIHALATTGHTLLSVTTVSFDMSLKEIGAALFNGLTLVFADEDQTTNPMLLAELFKKTKADVFNATPSRMLQYMELPAFVEAIHGSKVLMCGGEKYADGLLDKLREAAPEARIFNTYGPTEITVSSNCKDLTHTNRVSIGRPLLNVTEFIADKDGNELPQGIVGELYIGGMGVATGYNNLPEMTAERFIDYKGMRIYKSGDYAKWNDEGDVEILGRTDNQIKLRGLRIELGEVEAALAAMEGIKNVVVKIGKIKGEEHLCAYFTADRPVDIAGLKSDLGKTLTKYMVPTAYLQLDKMPLTPNGKTDVKALPEPQLALSGEYEEPANETERTIADIFARILQLEKVGANDNFYEIGGTSLITTRVIIEADKAGLKVAYGDVFNHPTPRKLANFVLGIETEEGKKDELADFDYTAINNLLKGNTLDAYRLGEKQPLGNVLITGATGYLGIHILHQLISSDAETIYCLVRGKDEESAAQRLKTLLFYYFENTYENLFDNRLRIVVGDVTEPIPTDLKVDTVINCAAIVKHFSEGTEIEDVNIGGAENCINYCLATGAKLVQVSTASTRGLSVNGVPAPNDIFTEQKLYMGQFLGNKYIYSKFIAERMVLEAAATKGLGAKIMRVGNLSARSTDGEFQANFQTNSFLGRLKVYNMLGYCPFEARDSQVEFSPINEVAGAIILLAQTPKECVVFHPYNNHNVLLGDVLTELREIGEGVKFVEVARFSEALNEAKEDPQKAKVLSSLLAYQNMTNGQKSADVLRSNHYTMQVLYRLGYSWSPTSWDYVDRFFTAIASLGYFDNDRD